MDSNYRPGLNWPVTSSGTGFSESSKACTSLPLSLSLHLPLRVLSLSSFFPETLSRNFTLSIRIFHQKLIPIISSFSLLFFFVLSFYVYISNCWGRLARFLLLFLENRGPRLCPSLPVEGLMSGIKPISKRSRSRLLASENLIVEFIADQ